MISSATLTRITTDPIYIELKKKIHAPAGNQTRVSSVAGTYTITVLPALIFLQAAYLFTPILTTVFSSAHPTGHRIWNRSYGAMAARWIPDPKVGGSNPSSFILFFFVQRKKKLQTK